MIGYIKGNILAKNSINELLVENNGIGYRVIVNVNVLANAIIGSNIELYTYQHIREDILALYGFLENSYVIFFMQMISVSGVGPKSAMAILDFCEPKVFSQAIINEDIQTLTLIQGIGKKTAQRMILELKNKLEKNFEDNLFVSNVVQYDFSKKEILEALISLGYTNSQAQLVISKIPKEIKDLSEQLKFALKNV